MRGIMVALFVSFVAFAGCAEEEVPEVEERPDEEAVLADDGRDLRTDLRANDTLQRPEWALGDWFGHHIFFGTDDTEGSHINTVIVEDLGGSWRLAPDSMEAAKWEAAWDFPMLGEVSKATLATTAFGSDWDLFQFPLSDGKTWSATIDPLFNGERTITLTASYNAEISTPYGDRPGFDIIGVNETGATEVVTDFVPDIGWYSRLTLLDTSTEDEGDYIIHVNSMGFGNNWTGTYFLAEADEKISRQAYMTPFDPAGSSPPEAAFFTMSQEDELYGIVFLLAQGGTSDFVMTDPAGKEHTWKAQHAAAQGSAQVFDFVDMEAQDGEWQWRWVGAGTVAVHFEQLFGITYTPVAFGEEG